MGRPRRTYNPADDAMDAAQVAPRVRAAVRRRSALLANPQTTACRLIHEAADGLPRLAVDRLGPALVVQDRQPSDPACVSQAVATLAALIEDGTIPGVRAIYLKPFSPDRSHLPDDKTSVLYQPTPTWGQAQPASVTVLENGLELTVRLWDGFSTGLFLDQRENRAWVCEHARGWRVLNTFCYTGSFSVAAIRGGAARVVSVDISRKYLEWAADNCRLAATTPGHWADRPTPGRSADHPAARAAGHPAAQTPGEFFCIPTGDFLRAASRRAEQYDLIIIDPPSFSRDRRGRVFSVLDDLGPLLKESGRLLAPGGYLLACTNHRQMTAQRLEGIARAALKEAGRQLSSLTALPMPEDFPGEPTVRMVRARVT